MLMTSALTLVQNRRAFYIAITLQDAEVNKLKKG